MAANKTQSGASYEAILIDKLSQPIDDIIKKVKVLEQVMTDAAKPATTLSNAIGSIGKGANKSINLRSNQLTGLQENLTKVRTTALSTGQGVSQALNSIASAAKAAGVALLGFSVAGSVLVADMLTVSAAATETENKFAVAFGGMTGQASSWARALSSSINRSETEIQDFSSTFQTLLTGYGFADAEAAGMSKTLTQLAFDLGSFNNVADDDAFQRLLSGITGSTEALERFGINTKASAIDQWLASKQIDRTNQNLDEQEKVLARLGVIYRATKKQQGDAARTGESWTNQIKALSSALQTLRKNAGRAFEQQLLKPLTSLVTVLRAAGESVANLDSGKVKAFLASLSTAATIGVSLLVLGTALTALAGVVITVSTLISGLTATASLLLALGLPGLMVAVGAAIAAIPVSIGLWAGLKTAMKSLWVDVSNLQAVFENLWESMVSGYYLAIRAIQGGRTDLAWEVVVQTAKKTFYRLGEEIYFIIGNAVRSGAEDALKQIGSTLLKANYFGFANLIDNSGTGSDFVDSMAEGYVRSEVALSRLRREIQLLNNEANSETSFGYNDGLIGSFTDKIKQGAEAAASAAKSESALAEAIAASNRAMAERKAFTDSLLTPMERFEKRVESVAGILAAMPKDVFDSIRPRALAALRKELKEIAEIEPAKKVNAPSDGGFRASSVGTSAAGFASGLGMFGPALDPLTQETKTQTKIMQASKQDLSKIKEGVAMINKNKVLMQ